MTAPGKNAVPVHSLEDRQRAAAALEEAFARARSVGVQIEVNGQMEDMVCQRLCVIGEGKASIRIDIIEVPF